jgi:queuine tRNA-ribosyltransferase
MKFELLGKTANQKKRAQVQITTDHGVIETPIFMPVGTVGTVKSVHQRELKKTISIRILF